MYNTSDCDCGFCGMCEGRRYQDREQREHDRETNYWWIKQDSHVYAWLDQQKPTYTPCGSLVRTAPFDIPF